MSARLAPTDQLSLVVDQDRRLDGLFTEDETPVRWAELNLSVAVRVRVNLQPSDELRLVVTDHHGNVIGGAEVVCETVSFPVVKDKGKPIGVKRCVSISTTDNDVFAPHVGLDPSVVAP